MKQLKILLEQTRYRLIYIAIFLVFVILTIDNWVYVLFLLPYSIYAFRNQKVLLKYMCVVLVVYIGSRMIQDSMKLNEQDEYEVTVISSKLHDDYTTAVVRYGVHKLNLSINEAITLEPGHRLRVIGELRKIDETTIPGNFDYKGYLQAKGIVYKLATYKYEVIGKRLHIYTIRYHLSNYISNVSPLSSEYVKTFVLGDKSDFDQSLKTDISKLGISHLFAISGMHISLIVLFIITVLKKMQVSNKKSSIIIVTILGIFTIMTAFSPSVMRAVLMYVLLLVNSKYGLKMSSIDVISFIFVVLIIINPYIYKNLGFTLSFIVATSILLSSEILKLRPKNTQLLLIGVISMVITIPITSSLNYNINFMAIFTNVLFIYFVSFLILPMSFITLIFPPFDIVYYNIIIVFERLTRSFSSVDLFSLDIGFTYRIIIILYYVFMLFLIRNTNKNQHIVWSFILYILLLFVISYSNLFNPIKQVVFLDVHGDSTIITDSFNKCNIIIDTGDIDDYNQVLNYLKLNNIKRVDYFVITHGHRDHFGEFDDIYNELNVLNVITNKDVSMLRSKNINCGSISMRFFESQTYQNENNNSVILLLNISDSTYLFTGDIESDREQSLMENKFPHINYIKVPHHGSRTSSTQLFLEYINPDAAIIIAARNNRHNHPHDDIISRYNDLGITIERTDNMGTISHRYLFGKEFKRYHQP